MKKAALTFGLFSLLMVATSFSAPETSNSTSAEMIVQGNSVEQNSQIDPDGNIVGKNKKKDDNYASNLGQNNKVDPDGNIVGKNKKLDR